MLYWQSREKSCHHTVSETRNIQNVYSLPRYLNKAKYSKRYLDVYRLRKWQINLYHTSLCIDCVKSELEKLTAALSYRPVSLSTSRPVQSPIPSKIFKMLYTFKINLFFMTIVKNRFHSNLFKKGITSLFLK